MHDIEGHLKDKVSLKKKRSQNSLFLSAFYLQIVLIVLKLILMAMYEKHI